MFRSVSVKLVKVHKDFKDWKVTVFRNILLLITVTYYFGINDVDDNWKYEIFDEQNFTPRIYLCVCKCHGQKWYQNNYVYHTYSLKHQKEHNM